MHSRIAYNRGFTLIELMIVVAIIGILAAVAIPNFLAYRYKSYIATNIGSLASVRSAIASYASDSDSNLFPLSISNWDELVAICNFNGGTLKENSIDQGLSLQKYATWDVDGDGQAGDEYYFIFYTNSVPSDLTGSMIEVRPSGIAKFTH